MHCALRSNLSNPHARALRRQPWRRPGQSPFCFPQKGEIELDVADHPELFTTDETGEIVAVDQPMSQLAAFLMDAKPAELPPGKTVDQLFNRPGFPAPSHAVVA